MSGFAYRGIVEGFYGPPWTHEDRLWLLDRAGEWGMNVYVYAPKDDPLHRARWREPYPDRELARFRELVERGARAGVRVGFAVSPGLSMRYADGEDRGLLREKLRSFRELGSDFLSLAVDDIPSRLAHEEDRARFASLAEAHVSVANELQRDLGPEVTLWVVPTSYIGCEPSPYLEELGSGLDPGIEVAWTGRTVVSPTIGADEAARRAKTLRRRLLVWDNTPVSDGPMRSMLHLGPYAGRDPDLPRNVSGLLLNPMDKPRASAVTLRAASDYLREPTAYDPEASWAAAIQEVGRGDPEAFRLFAEAHRFHPISPDDQDRELQAGLQRLEDALSAGRDATRALAELRAGVERRLSCRERLADLADPRLREEVTPWIEAHARETRRISVALDLIASLIGQDGGRSRAFALLGYGARVDAEPAAVEQSYGPRRVTYPQLAPEGDDGFTLGPDPALYRDLCLADRFVRLAEDLVLAPSRR